MRRLWRPRNTTITTTTHRRKEYDSPFPKDHQSLLTKTPKTPHTSLDAHLRKATQRERNALGRTNFELYTRVRSLILTIPFQASLDENPRCAGPWAAAAARCTLHVANITHRQPTQAHQQDPNRNFVTSQDLGALCRMGVYACVRACARTPPPRRDSWEMTGFGAFVAGIPYTRGWTLVILPFGNSCACLLA